MRTHLMSQLLGNAYAYPNSEIDFSNSMIMRMAFLEIPECTDDIQFVLKLITFRINNHKHNEK